MTPDEKMDRALQMLYEIKPIVERTEEDVRGLTGRLSAAEVKIGQHGVEIENAGADLDGLGKKVRIHVSDTMVHPGTHGSSILEHWKLAVMVISLFLSAWAVLK